MKRALLVLALAAVAFSGCIGGDGGPSSEETKLMVKEAVSGLESYRFGMKMDQAVEIRNLSGEGSVDGERISLSREGEINLTDRSSREISTIFRESLDGEERINEAVEAYFLEDTIYQRIGDDWIRLQQPDPLYGLEKTDQIALLVEIIERSKLEFERSERIEGVDTYRFKMIPDDDTAYAVMAGQISFVDPRLLLMINMTELLEEGSDMEWSVWIAKETSLPMRSEVRTRYVVTPDMLNLRAGSTGELSLSFETEETSGFGDYNEPLDLEPPQEAVDAPILFPSAPAGA